MVTAADRASEELLRARLVAARPHDAILGEEGEDRPGTSGVRWVLDPIDGTVNFLYGLPRHAVSVAAQVADDAAPDGWSTVAGTVLEVPTGSTWSAHLEDGQPVGARDGVTAERKQRLARPDLCRVGAQRKSGRVVAGQPPWRSGTGVFRRVERQWSDNSR